MPASFIVQQTTQNPVVLNDFFLALLQLKNISWAQWGGSSVLLGFILASEVSFRLAGRSASKEYMEISPHSSSSKASLSLLW